MSNFWIGLVGRKDYSKRMLEKFCSNILWTVMPVHSLHPHAYNLSCASLTLYSNVVDYQVLFRFLGVFIFLHYISIITTTVHCQLLSRQHFLACQRKCLKEHDLLHHLAFLNVHMFFL